MNVSVEVKYGWIWEGRVLARYMNHLIVEDHEYGIVEICLSDVIIVTEIL